MNQIEPNQPDQTTNLQHLEYTTPKLEQHQEWRYVIGFSIPGGGREMPSIPEPSIQTGGSE